MKNVEAIPVMPERRADSHKGDYGRVCIIAGSLGMSGAAVLTGRSALRSGAGLVRVAVPEAILPIVAASEPSYITVPLKGDSGDQFSVGAVKQLKSIIHDNDIVGFGPGLGVSKSLSIMANDLVGSGDISMVIDADGLNNLATVQGWHRKIRAKAVLTPHPGEMKRLWKNSIRGSMPGERLEQAQVLANESGTIVVLKGAGTVVSDGERVYVNRTGNPGMATAGSGDVLTGIITALAGQGLDLFDASVLGVYIHGKAGDIAAGRLGEVSVTAVDIIESLPGAFISCR